MIYHRKKNSLKAFHQGVYQSKIFIQAPRPAFLGGSTSRNASIVAIVGDSTQGYEKNGHDTRVGYKGAPSQSACFPGKLQTDADFRLVDENTTLQVEILVISAYLFHVVSLIVSLRPISSFCRVILEKLVLMRSPIYDELASTAHEIT